MRPIPLALALALLCPTVTAANPGDAAKTRAFVHDLEPRGVAEECLRLETGRSRRFEWTADGPLDFNIHYHKGDEVIYPVKLKGQWNGGGRFTAATGEDYCWMWTARGPTKVTGSLGAEESTRGEVDENRARDHAAMNFNATPLLQ